MSETQVHLIAICYVHLMVSKPNRDIGPPPLISANRIQCRCLVKDLDTVQVSSACLGLEDCHCTSVFLQGDHLEKHKSDFHPWSFPSLFALAGVTIEKGLHWLPKATIATRLQRGVALWSRSSAPARGTRVSAGFPVVRCGHPPILVKKKKNCQKFQKTFSINFLAKSGNFKQLWFFQLFFCLDLQKSHFLTFGNDHTVIVQYL